MKKLLILYLLMGLFAGSAIGQTQNKIQGSIPPKVEVYYFHPTDRCPIDQSIEANSKTVMQSFFAKEIRTGTIFFRVINTDDKATAKITAKFDINAQALYIVKLEKGKEIRKDLTRFAFDYGQSNPGKFKSGLKDEIEKALK